MKPHALLCIYSKYILGIHLIFSVYIYICIHIFLYYFVVHSTAIAHHSLDIFPTAPPGPRPLCTTERLVGLTALALCLCAGVGVGGLGTKGCTWYMPGIVGTCQGYTITITINDMCNRYRHRYSFRFGLRYDIAGV